MSETEQSSKRAVSSVKLRDWRIFQPWHCTDIPCGKEFYQTEKSL